MFYSLFPLILIFASLAAIVMIVVRKFPQMSALEPEKLPEVKQAKIKEEIRLLKFNRALSVFGKKLSHWFEFFVFAKKGWLLAQTKFRAMVFHLRERYQKSIVAELRQAIKDVKEVKKVGEEKNAAKRKSREKKETAAVLSSGNLLEQAEKFLNQGDLTAAERKFIEAIKMNAKEIEAYRGLGKVYLEMKKYKEAKETFEFLLKLQPDDDRAYNRLGMVAEEQGDWKQAVKYFEEAVRLNDHLAVRFYDLGRAYAALQRPAAGLRNFAKAADIEPNNPKYLDQLLEMSIITGDVDLAKEIYNRLRLVNPDNAKLVEFKQRIEEVEE